MTMVSSSLTTTDIIMMPNSIPTSTEVMQHSISSYYTTTLSLSSTTSLVPTNTLSVSRTQNTVSRGNPTSEVLVTSKKSSPSNSISEPTVLGNTGNDNTITVIAAVVSTILVLLIISIIMILIAIAIAYKKRRKATLLYGGHDSYLVNATYSDITPNGKEDKGLKDMCNPNYDSQGTCSYIMPKSLFNIE